MKRASTPPLRRNLFIVWNNSRGKINKTKSRQKKPLMFTQTNSCINLFPSYLFWKEIFFVLFGFMTLISRNSFYFYFLDFFFGYDDDDDDVMMGFYFKYRFLAVCKGAVNWFTKE